MDKIRIFISYAHADEQWKDRILMHLVPLSRNERIIVWHDESLKLGEQWEKKIDEQLSSADIAVMLISPAYLASNYISDKEMPKLLDRQRLEQIVILPVILVPCLWQMVNWLSKIQVLPRGGKPVSDYNKPDEAIAQIASSIIEITEILTAKKENINSDQVNDVQTNNNETKLSKLHDSLRVFISHANDDGDFAELIKYKLEKVGFEAWIDTDRLIVGDDWRQKIDDAIKNSFALIVVVTPEAKVSEYVTYEWAFAWGANIKVVPIMLKPTQLHPRLESLHYLDFSNRRARPWIRLIKKLKE